jgi:hypothetical protein
MTVRRTSSPSRHAAPDGLEVRRTTPKSTVRRTTLYDGLLVRRTTPHTTQADHFRSFQHCGNSVNLVGGDRRVRIRILGSTIGANSLPGRSIYMERARDARDHRRQTHSFRWTEQTWTCRKTLHTHLQGPFRASGCRSASVRRKNPLSRPEETVYDPWFDWFRFH